MNRVLTVVVALLCVYYLSHDARGGMLYYFDFDNGMPSQFSGVANSLEGVEGYAGLGTGGNVFSGKLLRNASGGNPAMSTVLSLSGLAPHVSIDLSFLLAIIDSWDGASSSIGGSQRVGDYLNIKLDGRTIFRQAFDAFDPADGYRYPSGGLLANGRLGFNPLHPDSAYDMGLEPSFHSIPHQGSTLTIEWFADGPGWDGGTDESWGIDNLRIALNAVPEPSSLVSACSGLAVLIAGTVWRKEDAGGGVIQRAANLGTIGIPPSPPNPGIEEKSKNSIRVQRSIFARGGCGTSCTPAVISHPPRVEQATDSVPG